jgi:proliferating cell nuclear antigen
MFEAKLGNAGLLKRIIDAVKDLVTDAPFDCSEGGLSLQAMDSSHVALVSLKLEAGGFETYRCDRSQSIGISMTTLAKILKCADSGDTATLKYEEDEDTLEIKFEAAEKERTQECKMKLMDLDAEHLGIPDQDYACTVTMPSHEFQKACRDLSMFTDTLSICATKNGIEFKGKGDAGDHLIRWQQSANADKPKESVIIDLKEAVTCTFAIKYMQHFIKATNLSGQVTLCMSQDIPIVVEYKIFGDPEEQDEIGFLRFYLAPKIEDEDIAEN